jgi:hypothetical protein
VLGSVRGRGHIGRIARGEERAGGVANAAIGGTASEV